MAMYKSGEMSFSSGNYKSKRPTQAAMHGQILTHEYIDQDPVKGRKTKSKEKANVYLVPQTFQLSEREEDN